MPVGRRQIHYPHALACVEAVHKTVGEWQIRELPQGFWQADYDDELFTGEHPGEVEANIARCRPLLREQHARSRARAFVWYLREGPLVTFYRKTRLFEIEILGRYLVRHGDEPNVSHWAEDYPALLDQLWLKSPA